MKQVWYHKDCMDGLGALVAYLHSLEEYSHEMLGMSLIPMNYGDDYDVTGGDTIIMLDFSVKEDVMRDICSKVSRVLVVDHHKTAQAELEKCADITNLVTYFEMERSGAVLAWKYFQPFKPVPLLLKYIQDRDLWQWQMERSKEISACLSEWRLTMGFRKLIGTLDTLLSDTKFMMSKDHMIDSGINILNCHRNIFQSIADTFESTMLMGHPVLSVNSPIFQSEIGDYLNTKIHSEKRPEKFVVAWCERHGKREYSMRSQGDFDVSEIAIKRGGGGHRNAAGFTEDITITTAKNT